MQCLGFIFVASDSTPCIFATAHEVTDEIDDFLHTNQELINNVSLIIRLCNDLGTTVAERERGDAASSILCYMNQMEVSEEEARKHIKDTIKTAWKKINGHCFTRVAPVRNHFLLEPQMLLMWLVIPFVRMEMGLVSNIEISSNISCH